MALRSAYKERTSPSREREEFESTNSVDNLTKGSRKFTPAKRGNPTPSGTSDVIENAFGFLGNEQFDAYSRFNSDTDNDIDAGTDDNFSFGPPKNPGYGQRGGIPPSSASYDRREVPRGTRQPFNTDRSASGYDHDSIGLAKGLADRFGGLTESMEKERRERLKKALNGHANGHANGRQENTGHVNRGYVNDTNSNYAPSAKPDHRGRADIYTIDEDRGDYPDDVYRYPSEHSRFSEDRSRYPEYASERFGYPDDRSRYTDERSQYSDDVTRYPPGDQAQYTNDRPRLPRYQVQPEHYGNDYRNRSPDGYVPPKPGVVQKKSDKTYDSVDNDDKRSNRCCLIIIILVIGLLIVGGVIAVVVLHFLGFFSSQADWTDSYQVAGTFRNTYITGMSDSTSEDYKTAADHFNTLTNGILGESKHRNGYDVDLKQINQGSQIYIFTVNLRIITTADELKQLLEDGYKKAKANNETVLDLLGIEVTADLDTTLVPEITTPKYTPPERTTPITPAGCTTLTEPKCTGYNYVKYGNKNLAFFTELAKIVSRNCYSHAQEFSCVASYPPCSNDGLSERLPCWGFCNELRDSCKSPIACGPFLDDDVATLCYLSPKAPPTDETVTRTPFPADCPVGKFRCGGGACKINSLRCDGNDDCGDYSDEVKCNSQTTTKLDCDFQAENDRMCGYTNDNSGHFGWMMHNGATPSLNTGPLTDHTTWDANSGFYMYAEASGQYPQSKARLKSVSVTITTESCLRFYYHMLGDQMETLKVYQYFVNQATSKERLLWQRSRDHGDNWIFTAVTLPNGTYQIIFEAVRGNGFRSDIAIDDISARANACPQEIQGCQTEEFSCTNGNCVHKDFTCNGLNDCGDYSDEMDCTCTVSEFKCTLGMCIPGYLRCDKKSDCPDATDELDCDSVCSHGRHQCADGSCILPEWVCDHENDCPDNSDEENCKMCSADEWQCRDNGCIPRTGICNTTSDCLDGSDEINCFRLGANNVMEITKNAPDNWLALCSFAFPGYMYEELCNLLGHLDDISHSVTKIDISSTQGFVRFSESLGTTSFLQQFPELPCADREVITVQCSSSECGTPKTDGHVSAFIVNGHDATAGQWPWQIGLYHKVNSNYQFSCGGTLIGHNHVVTAAHCVKYSLDGSNYRIIVGATTRTGAPDSNRREVGVSHIKKHAGFTDVIWGDDIAVITLNEYIEYNDYIKPICLPNILDIFPSNAHCYVSGWGRTDFYNTSTVPMKLQEAKVKLWSDEQCSAAHVNYIDKMTCAGYKSGYISNCPGDSGGPLQCQDVHGKWKLYGVFSFFVRGCNVPMQPPVFTKVQKYIIWIEEAIECKFVCTNKKCLMNSADKCNGVDDCGDSSDEVACSTSLTSDFEDNFMNGYTFPKAKNSWQRVKSVIEFNKGPITDQTKGDGTGYFMYAGSGKSYLISPIKTRTTPGCLQYSIHGRGSPIGSLHYSIFTVPNNINHASNVDVDAAIFTLVQLPQIDVWDRKQLDLSAGTFVVIFRSTSAVGVPGYISIDDIVLKDGTCTSQSKTCPANEKYCDLKCIAATQVCNYQVQCIGSQDELTCPTQGTYTCTLENYRDCFLEQTSILGEETLDWTWIETSVSQQSGPAGDHTTGNYGGHVLLLNTKIAAPASYATISLAVKVLAESCLSFYYNMNTTGTLRVITCVTPAVCMVNYQVQAKSAVAWTEVQLELVTNVRGIKFYGFAGPRLTDATQSYMAIDDISIKPGVCSNIDCRSSQFKCSSGTCIDKVQICNGLNDCDDGSDEAETLCRDATKMGPDMFRCDDGWYRQRLQRCDNTNNCPDNSDEADCSTCRSDEFPCPDGKCKNRYSKNDGHNDCADKSDEGNTCESYQFSCLNGDCIPGFRYCDGVMDCPDNSDEPFKGCQCNINYHFRCTDNKCIPKEFDCDGDGVAHCTDGTDESPNRCQFQCGDISMFTSQVCNAKPQCLMAEDESVNCECPYSYRACSYGGCIPENKICDGIYDCLDHSDEAGCTCEGDTPFKCDSGRCLAQSSRCNWNLECDDWSDELGCSSLDAGCPSNYFACNNGVCVPNANKCDGQNQCGDGSDEFDCSCSGDEYLCAVDKRCIPTTWKCDRYNDCSDGADETGCSASCTGDQFECNYLQYGCVTAAERCDGTNHCPDGSDELTCEKFEATTSHLQVMKGTEWTDVCSTRWNNAWSNDICMRLGKGAAVSTEEIAKTSTKYLVIKATVTVTSNPTFKPDMFEDVQSCDSGKVLKINCAESVCGIPPPMSTAMLIGGTVAVRNDWPWMVAVLYAGKPRCGGVIIQQDLILTAAHCFQSQMITDGKLKLTPQYIRVVSSTTKLAYPNSTISANDLKRIESEVAEIVIHPEFKSLSNNVLVNDIALVKLKNPILPNNKDVRYICRPPSTEELPVKAKCFAAGWGVTDYNNADGVPITVDLQESRMDVWSDASCRATDMWGSDIEAETHLCAGITSGSKAVCNGDSGGPLVCQKPNGIWEVVGITSFGQSNCGQGSGTVKPGVFTRVSGFDDWITAQINA